MWRRDQCSGCMHMPFLTHMLLTIYTWLCFTAHYAPGKVHLARKRARIWGAAHT